MDFPRTVDEITPEWLTQVLRESGAVREAKVNSFDVIDIGDDTGLTADLNNIQLAYDFDEDSAPASVISKQTRPDLLGEVGLAGIREAYGREIGFYGELAPQAGIRSPATYFAGQDSTTGEMMLLLEDLGRYRLVDQADDCSYEDAVSVVASLAKMHAKWWNNDELTKYKWLLDRPTVARPVAAQENFSKGLETFLSVFGDFIPLDVEPLARKLEPRIPAVVTALASPPFTLVHGDFKLGNIFFDDLVEPENSVIAYDWQVAGRFRSASDVGLFILQSFTTDSRRKLEHQLLSDYYCRLTDLGVSEYSYEQFLSDVRLAILPRLVVRVNTFSNAGRRYLGTEDGVLRAKKMLEGLQMLVDWNCEDVIPK